VEHHGLLQSKLSKATYAMSLSRKDQKNKNVTNPVRRVRSVFPPCVRGYTSLTNRQAVGPPLGDERRKAIFAL
jgi:hypothetical protein